MLCDERCSCTCADRSFLKWLSRDLKRGPIQDDGRLTFRLAIEPTQGPIGVPLTIATGKTRILDWVAPLERLSPRILFHFGEEHGYNHHGGSKLYTALHSKSTVVIRQYAYPELQIYNPNKLEVLPLGYMTGMLTGKVR